MICQMCKEAEATVHLTQVIGGKIRKLDLCAACAEKCGVDDPAGFSMIELLKKFAGLFTTDTAVKKEEAPVKGKTLPGLCCPVCGYSEAELTKTGRLGCPSCYTTFEKNLEKALKTMHRGTRHIGKEPSEAALREAPVLEEKATDTLKSDKPASKKRAATKKAATKKTTASKPRSTKSKKAASAKKAPSVEENLLLMQGLLESKKVILDEAVEVENYEYAAKIRDEIIELEKKIENFSQPTKEQEDDAL